jgi:ABC-2 type transport system permease protein
MAVYKNNYGVYRGELTPERSRFLVLTRYAFGNVFRSRMFVAFYVLCFAMPFTGLLLIYLHHNVAALGFLNLPLDQLKDVLPIDAAFFRFGIDFQGGLCFLIAFFVGPALVAPDLRNNGLALYLSRPFTRSEYVLGKTAVLAILMSLVTWVPGLLLFGFQAYLEGFGWVGESWTIAWAILAGSLIWIATLSLLTLAVSAWVKWKPVARITLLVIYLVLVGFGFAINNTLHTWWGWLFSISTAIENVWAGLFGLTLDDERMMPYWAAWLTLSACCTISLWLLSRRVRAYEVVR